MAAMVLKSKKEKKQNFFVCFYNPLSPIYATHVWMSVGPTSEAWLTY